LPSPRFSRRLRERPPFSGPAAQPLLSGTIARMPSDFMLDFDRVRRLGFPEVVLAAGKETGQIVAIIRQLARENDVLVTRLTRDAWDELSREAMPGHADYDERSRTLVVRVGKSNRFVPGDVAIVTAG